jgi:hypothetical protein
MHVDRPAVTRDRSGQGLRERAAGDDGTAPFG